MCIRNSVVLTELTLNITSNVVLTTRAIQFSACSSSHVQYHKEVISCDYCGLLLYLNFSNNVIVLFIEFQFTIVYKLIVDFLLFEKSNELCICVCVCRSLKSLSKAIFSGVRVVYKGFDLMLSKQCKKLIDESLILRLFRKWKYNDWFNCMS